MALTSPPKTTNCPNCNAMGPLNFVMQDRVTIKQADSATSSDKELYDAIEVKRVYACAYCGHILCEI